MNRDRAAPFSSSPKNFLLHHPDQKAFRNIKITRKTIQISATRRQQLPNAQTVPCKPTRGTFEPHHKQNRIGSGAQKGPCPGDAGTWRGSSCPVPPAPAATAPSPPCILPAAKPGGTSRLWEPRAAGPSLPRGTCGLPCLFAITPVLSGTKLCSRRAAQTSGRPGKLRATVTASGARNSSPAQQGRPPLPRHPRGPNQRGFQGELLPGTQPGSPGARGSFGPSRLCSCFRHPPNRSCFPSLAAQRRERERHACCKQRLRIPAHTEINARRKETNLQHSQWQ